MLLAYDGEEEQYDDGPDGWAGTAALARSIQGLFRQIRVECVCYPEGGFEMVTCLQQYGGVGLGPEVGDGSIVAGLGIIVKCVPSLWVMHIR
jgi:hypothetical protein